MAIAFDAATDGNTVTSTSLTYSHTVTGSNPFLVVGTLGSTTTDKISGVTYNGVAMTKLNSYHIDTTDRWLSAWYLANPATGAHNVVVTSSSSDFIASSAASYTGVSAVVDSSATSTNTTSTGDLPNATTTVKDNSWHIMVGGLASGTPTAGTSTTRRVLTTGGNMAIFDGNIAITPAGSNTINMTRTGGSNAGYALIGLSIGLPAIVAVAETATLTETVSAAKGKSSTTAETATLTETVSSTAPTPTWNKQAKSSNSWSNQSKS